jgi:primosomal protein N'
MIECKVCGHEYHQARNHCPVCNARDWGTLTVEIKPLTEQLVRLVAAHGAARVKQNLYDGKVLGLKVR